MKLSLALCLVAGLALLHCGAADSYYRSENNYGGGSYESCKQCNKKDVPGPGIKAEDGLVSSGFQWFTCNYGYKPKEGSQAKATCECGGYWSVQIDCIKDEYNYGQQSYGGQSYGGQTSSYGGHESYDHHDSYDCGVLAEWAQCGGKSGVCYNGVGPCEDKEWCHKCPYGQTCQRQSEWYWQCVPPSNTYNNNYNTNNDHSNSNYNSNSNYHSNNYENKYQSYGRRR